MTEKSLRKQIEEVLEYTAPDPEQVEKFRIIRKAAIDFVEAIYRAAPSCADRTAAIRDVRRAMMSANAAVALRGKSLPP